MLGATVQSVVATVTWHSGFEHPIADLLHVELYFSDPFHHRDLLYKDRINWPCIQRCPLSTPCFSSCLPYVFLHTASCGNLRIFDCDPRSTCWASVQIKRECRKCSDPKWSETLFRSCCCFQWLSVPGFLFWNWDERLTINLRSWTPL